MLTRLERAFLPQRMAPMGVRWNSNGGKVSGPVIGIDLGSECERGLVYMAGR